MLIGDGSSDVCSSDLPIRAVVAVDVAMVHQCRKLLAVVHIERLVDMNVIAGFRERLEVAALLQDKGLPARSEERRVGKSVSVSVDLGGSRIMKQNKKKKHY